MSRRVDVAAVLAEIRDQLARPDVAPEPPRPPGPAIAELRDRLARFRAEPIGGRLGALKRIAFWFVASAFDRQTKLLEAMVDALEAQQSEIERSRAPRSEGAPPAPADSGRDRT